MSLIKHIFMGGNIYTADTDKLITRLRELQHLESLVVSLGGDDACEFFRLHDYIVAFDENLAHIKTCRDRDLRDLLLEIKSWT